MPLINMQDLRDALPRGKCLIGIDPGRRTIGLALSDVGLTLAGPYGSLARGKLRQNAAEILTIAHKEGAAGLVIGLPLEMEGTFGPAAQAARDWAQDLSAMTGLPAAMWDERQTTSAVHDMLIHEADMGRKRRSQIVDKMAAARILQAALDAK